MTNLTDNAVKYGVGDIDVRVRARDSKAVIEVADHGPGIPSTDAVRVFDRFYRGTQRDVAGSGLGLGDRQARGRTRPRYGHAREQSERLALYRHVAACLK